MLSAAEVTAFFRQIVVLKHRAALMVCYGSGLRNSEAIALKVSDIDSSRMLIRVQQGKAAKDRLTVLSQRLLLLLREYWKRQRPKDWLFPGTRPRSHICANTTQQVLSNLPFFMSASLLRRCSPADWFSITRAFRQTV